jgi:hypothetical protein
LSALKKIIPEAGILRRLTVGLPLMILLSACGVKQVVVEGNFPKPLMTPVPLSLGVWYPEDFANHEFFDETKTRKSSEWIVRTGQAQVQMWDTLLGGMFENLVHLQQKPVPGNEIPGVEAVLVPHVEELQYAIPAQTNIKVYEIWIRYRFELLSSSGELIAEWTMPAYGKTPPAFLQSAEAAVNLAAVMALRDAGANFAVNFSRVPDVQQWLRNRRETRKEVRI